MARSFNGSSEYIDFGTGLWTPIVAAGSNLTFTLSGWIYLISAPAIIGSVIGGVSSSSSNNLYLHVQSNATMQLTVNDQFGGNIGGTATSALSLNTWYHVAATFSGTGSGNPATVTLYLNGVSTTPNSANFFGFTSSSVSWRAGADNATSVRYLNARLADIAVWPVVLSALEVASLARGIRPNLIRPLSMLRWWPFAGLQSPEPDLSGNKNNGTLTGTQPVFGPPLGLATPMIHGRTIPQFPPPQPPIYSVAGFAYSEW